MRRVPILLCLAFLLPFSARAGALEDYAGVRARFWTAMGAIATASPGVIVTSRLRTEQDQARLAEQGYRPHPHSQHKLGLAWDLAAPEDALDGLRALAAAQGFTALIMTSPVTGNRYLHVQRYARSPLRDEPVPEPDATEEVALAAADPVPPPAPEPAVEAPRPIDGAALHLPRRLLRKKADGRIVLLLQVSEQGRVVDVAVDSSDLPEFEDFVTEAVQGWSFTPAMQAGRPVAALARLPIPIRIR